MRRAERPVSGLPRFLLVGFILAVLLQVVTHQMSLTERSHEYRPLATPYSESIYRTVSMGSQRLASYLLSIRLQLHDNQVGQHIRYRLIDYDLLSDWLNIAHRLNPESLYPMHLASRVYSQTTDESRMRKMLQFVDQVFESNPQLFWRNQAEATVIAKHQVKDLKLALKMAEKLYRQPANVKMPQWARDMHFLLLADLNQYETSIAIIMALLQDDSITDRDERRFLKERLLEFKQKLSETGQ